MGRPYLACVSWSTGGLLDRACNDSETPEAIALRDSCSRLKVAVGSAGGAGAARWSSVESHGKRHSAGARPQLPGPLRQRIRTACNRGSIRGDEPKDERDLRATH